MRLLLDTDVSLWAIEDSPKLSQAAKALISDPANDVFVSVASLWEIAVKHAPKRRGPSAMKLSAAEAADYFDQSGFVLLVLGRAHVLALEGLPMLHGDPFDRILVAQAVSEPMRLLTRDKKITAYGDVVMLV